MLEIMVGMFGLAVVTGLIFVRFSRPTARMHFRIDENRRSCSDLGFERVTVAKIRSGTVPVLPRPMPVPIKPPMWDFRPRASLRP